MINKLEDKSMTRLLFGYVVSMVVAATLSVGAASAAPATTAAKGSDMTALVRPIETAHWVWHHHHRIWVSDHHRHY